jgi:serine/threonine protein phosphatase PrpC
MLSETSIRQMVLSAQIPQQACQALVSEANRHGGNDNISVFIIRPEQLLSWQQVMGEGTQIRRPQSPGIR